MSKKMNKSGFSMVEILVAIVLLVVLVVGGSAVMYQTGGGIQRQQNKREAIVTANSIMERIWNLSYDDLEALSGVPISTNAVVNGINMAGSIDIGTETTDADGNPYIELQVELDHLGEENDIVITTRRYEYGISRAAL